MSVHQMLANLIEVIIDLLIKKKSQVVLCGLQGVYQHNLDLLSHWFCYSSFGNEPDLVIRASHYLVLMLALPQLCGHVWTRAHTDLDISKIGKRRKVKENLMQPDCGAVFLQMFVECLLFAKHRDLLMYRTWCLFEIPFLQIGPLPAFCHSLFLSPN